MLAHFIRYYLYFRPNSDAFVLNIVYFRLNRSQMSSSVLVWRGVEQQDKRNDYRSDMVCLVDVRSSDLGPSIRRVPLGRNVERRTNSTREHMPIGSDLSVDSIDFSIPAELMYHRSTSSFAEQSFPCKTERLGQLGVDTYRHPHHRHGNYIQRSYAVDRQLHGSLRRHERNQELDEDW